jgi:hypothetical protein
MLDVDEIELTAVRNAFCMLVARWRLTQSEVRDLLGETSCRQLEGRILPDVLSADAETRVRLLLRLDSALERLAQGADVAAQLRSDRSGAGATPLAMLGSLPVLRSAVRSAERECRDDRPARWANKIG